MTEEVKPIEDIVYVCERSGTLYFLLITYYPGHGANAAGYLFRRKVGSDGPAENILANERHTANVVVFASRSSLANEHDRTRLDDRTRSLVRWWRGRWDDASPALRRMRTF